MQTTIAEQAVSVLNSRVGYIKWTTSEPRGRELRLTVEEDPKSTTPYTKPWILLIHWVSPGADGSWLKQDLLDAKAVHDFERDDARSRDDLIQKVGSVLDEKKFNTDDFVKNMLGWLAVATNIEPPDPQVNPRRVVINVPCVDLNANLHSRLLAVFVPKGATGDKLCLQPIDAYVRKITSHTEANVTNDNGDADFMKHVKGEKEKTSVVVTVYHANSGVERCSNTITKGPSP